MSGRAGTWNLLQRIVGSSSSSTAVRGAARRPKTSGPQVLLPVSQAKGTRSQFNSACTYITYVRYDTTGYAVVSIRYWKSISLFCYFMLNCWCFKLLPSKALSLPLPLPKPQEFGANETRRKRMQTRARTGTGGGKQTKTHLSPD